MARRPLDLTSFAVTAGAVTPVSVDVACHLPQSTVVTPPQVPIPLPAIALLMAALLYAGVFSRRSSAPRSERSRRRG